MQMVSCAHAADFQRHNITGALFKIGGVGVGGGGAFAEKIKSGATTRT